MVLLIQVQESQIAVQLTAAQSRVGVARMHDGDAGPLDSAVVSVNRGQDPFMDAIRPAMQWVLAEQADMVEDGDGAARVCRNANLPAR